MVSFADLLEKEKVRGGILSYLSWNDLLRLRRVTKSTRDVITPYMKIHPELAPELEINEESKSFEAFMTMGIPTTKLFLNNVSGHRFYERNWEHITKFLQEYGLSVKMLRVKEHSMYLHGREWDFLDALKNMTSYQAASVGIGQPITNDVDQEMISRETYLLAQKCELDPRVAAKEKPAFFGRLKRLQIGGGLDSTGTGLVIGNMVTRFPRMLLLCPQLDHLGYPFSSAVAEVGARPDTNKIMHMAFTALQAYIYMRVGEDNLKTLDFGGFHEDQNLAQNAVEATEAFMELCLTCLQNNVKLLHVAPNWFQHRDAGCRSELASPELGKVVVSLVNVRSEIFPLDMPNLERVDVRDSSKCDVDYSDGKTRPEWPALKSLDITMYYKKVMVVEVTTGSNATRTLLRDVNDLFNFFFRGVRRLSVVELRLNFAGHPNQMEAPKVEDIVEACPNLKRLTIVKWPGTNKALTKLWAGLKGLEEVVMEQCKDLGNVAFVGEDQTKPGFLWLKKLKKLSLKGLNEMPKITNTLFSLVIQHLPLTHFTVTSTSPVESVTVAGVESLLDEPFAKSIEKFPFGTWSLAKLPAEEWNALEKKFRSFQML